MKASTKQFQDAAVCVYADGSVCFLQGCYQAVEVNPSTAKQIARYLAKRLLLRCHRWPHCGCEGSCGEVT